MSDPEDRREELQEIKGILTEIGEKVGGIRFRVEHLLEEEQSDAVREDHPSRRMWLALQGISEGSSQEEILSLYLSATREYLERAVLFLHRGSRYVPWKAYELDLRRVEPVDEGGSDPLSLAAGNREIVVVRTDLIQSFSWLETSGTVPEVAICVPFLLGERVPVILYGDSSRGVHPAEMELLTQVTLLLLKHHSIRTRLAELSSSDPAGREPGPPRLGIRETGSAGQEGQESGRRHGGGRSLEPPVASGPAAEGGARGSRTMEAGEAGVEEAAYTLSDEGIPPEIQAIHHGPSIAEDLPSPPGTRPYGAQLPKLEKKGDSGP